MVLFDRPKPAMGCSANGRRIRRRIYIYLYIFGQQTGRQKILHRTKLHKFKTNPALLNTGRRTDNPPLVILLNTAVTVLLLSQYCYSSDKNPSLDVPRYSTNITTEAPMRRFFTVTVRKQRTRRKGEIDPVQVIKTY